MFNMGRNHINSVTVTDGYTEVVTILQKLAVTQRFLLWKGKDCQTCEYFMIHQGCLLRCCPHDEAGWSSVDWHIAVTHDHQRCMFYR